MNTENGLFNEFVRHLFPRMVRRQNLKITYTFCLGGLAFTAFMVLIATGLLLLFYYQPSSLFRILGSGRVIHSQPSPPGIPCIFGFYFPAYLEGDSYRRLSKTPGIELGYRFFSALPGVF